MKWLIAVLQHVFQTHVLIGCLEIVPLMRVSDGSIESSTKNILRLVKVTKIETIDGSVIEMNKKRVPHCMKGSVRQWYY